MITCKNNFDELVTLPKKKFKFRPSVYGLIRNGDKICICRNKSNGKIWFPGGGVEKGEGHREALIREIKEETGLQTVRISKLIGSFENYFYYQPEDMAMHAFLYFYDCSTDEVDLFSNEQIDDGEARDLQWIEPNKIKKEDLGSLNKELFHLIKTLNKNNAGIV